MSKELNQKKYKEILQKHNYPITNDEELAVLVKSLESLALLINNFETRKKREQRDRSPPDAQVR